VVYEKPESLVKCDYVWKRTDRWINFPWSSLPPVVPGVLDALADLSLIWRHSGSKRSRGSRQPATMLG
jgi:hypothetical protein